MRRDKSIDDKMKMLQMAGLGKNYASVHELNKDESERDVRKERKSLIVDDREFDADFEAQLSEPKPRTRIGEGTFTFHSFGLAFYFINDFDN